jgi:hypothetical protein
VVPHLDPCQPEEIPRPERFPVAVLEPVRAHEGSPEAAQVLHPHAVIVNFQRSMNATHRGALEPDVDVRCPTDHVPAFWKLDGPDSSLVLDVQAYHDSLLLIGSGGDSQAVQVAAEVSS